MLPNLVDMVVNCYYVNPLYQPNGVTGERTVPVNLSENLLPLMARVFRPRMRLYGVGLGHHVWVVGEYGSIRKRVIMQEAVRYWPRRFGTQCKSHMFSSYYVPSSYFSHSS